MRLDDGQARRRWAGRGRFRGVYAFFNRRIELLTDDEAVFLDFDAIYRLFRSPGAPAPGEQTLPLFLLRAERGDGFFLYLAGRLFQFPLGVDLEVYFFLFNYLVDQVRDCTIIHGAALADRGKGLVLAANSGIGKSTLTLELLGRGKKFLSDELACLGEGDGELQAFPRALSVKRSVFEGFLARGKCPPPAAERIIGDQDRVMISVEDLFPGSRLDRCRLQTVILLEPPALAGRGGGLRTMEVRFFSLPPALLEDLKRSPGLVELTADPAGPHPRVRLRYQARTLLVPILQSLADRHGVAIHSHYPEGKGEIDYSRPPRLTGLTPAEGLLGLCRYVLNSRVRTDGPAAGRQRLLVSLARRLRGVRFYRMTPGLLSEMADRIETLHE